jgi:hypothetical protein
LKRVLPILLAALVFVTVLIARLPAAWVLPALRGRLQCASAAGTVWNGDCTGASIGGLSLNQLAWHVQAPALLRGRLVARLSAVRRGASASGTLSLAWHGPIAARDVFARVPIDPEILPAVPAYIAGTIEAHLEHVVIARDGALESLRGRVTLLHLVDSSGQVTPLGSFAATFPGNRGEPIGRLHDLGGPLALRGTLRLTAAPGYALRAEVAPRASASPSLLQALQYLGAPDAAGRRPFDLEGSY